MRGAAQMQSLMSQVLTRLASPSNILLRSLRPCNHCFFQDHSPMSKRRFFSIFWPKYLTSMVIFYKKVAQEIPLPATPSHIHTRSTTQRQHVDNAARVEQPKHAARQFLAPRLSSDNILYAHPCTCIPHLHQGPPPHLARHLEARCICVQWTHQM